jgi:hypothetical protein
VRQLTLPTTEKSAELCPSCGQPCDAYPGRLFNCPSCRLAFVVTVPGRVAKKQRWKGLAPEVSRDDNLTTSPTKNAHGYGDSLGGAVESLAIKDSTHER